MIYSAYLTDYKVHHSERHYELQKTCKMEKYTNFAKNVNKE